MSGTLSRITSLLTATTILLVGHGLQLTLLPLHALDAGWSGTAIAWTGSFYYLGFLTGCMRLPGTVATVGHIRSFMVMAAIATAALLAAALFVSVPAWLVLRFASGFALAGLYMVIESWLTEVSPGEQRGRVLSIYLILSLLGMAIGQILIATGSAGDLRLFVLGALLIAIAIVPVGLTRVHSPQPIPHVRFEVRSLLRSSRVAVVCVALAGMVVGGFWTLGPIVARGFGLDAGSVGLLMSFGVVGGAAAQAPVGRFSDSMDRRLVIGAVSVIGVAAAVFAWLFAGSSVVALYASFFLLGATSMPLYALCIALASDRTDSSLVEVASGMLLAHSAGSIVGPLLVSPMIGRGSSRVYFVYAAVCLALSAGWTFYRYSITRRPRPAEPHAAMLPRTTQAVAGLVAPANPTADPPVGEPASGTNDAGVP